MRGVLRFAAAGWIAALAGLSPLEALARDVSQASAQEPAVASPALRAAVVAASLLGSLLVFRRLFRREAALGRGKALPAPAELDAEWLQRHLFVLPPELVGFAYAGRVGGAEVAAVLARMHAESKLASRVASGSRGWNNLELWLLVDRAELGGYERELVDCLFFDGNTTSGDRIRERYGALGFDPAALLARHLRGPRDAVLGVRPPSRWLLPVACAGAGLGLLAVLVSAPPDLPVLVGAVLGGLGPVWGTFVLAPRWRRHPERHAIAAWPCVAATGASLLGLALLIMAWPSLPPSGAIGVAAWGLAGAATVARVAASRESRDGLDLRRNLLAARRFFAAELERTEPRMRDEWLPYLIALELSGEVAYWYLAHGRLETAARLRQLAHGADPEGRDTFERAWTGGAGALGGIGESGAWTAAASALGVPPGPGQRRAANGWASGLELRPA